MDGQEKEEKEEEDEEKEEEEEEEEEKQNVELSPREIRRRAERREAQRQRLENEAHDAATTRCAVTVVLRDKGTRMNCELWCAGGVVVQHAHCRRPCLLTTSAAVPDSYHAGHATVYFAPAEVMNPPPPPALLTASLLVCIRADETWQLDLIRVRAFPSPSLRRMGQEAALNCSRQNSRTKSLWWFATAGLILSQTTFQRKSAAPQDWRITVSWPW